MMKQLNKTTLFLLATFLLPLVNFAQEAQASQQSYFSNSLFNTLLIVIIVLILVILVLGQSLRNISEGDFVSNKLIEKKKQDSAGAGKITSLLLLLLLGNEVKAGNGSQTDWTVGGLDMATFYFMLAIIMVEVIVIVVLYYTFVNLLGTGKRLETDKPKVKTKTILEKINASVDIEEEKDILLDHDYDGIKELDNDLPPWWKYGFYLTIVIGIIYMINFHVANTGDLQDAEYTKAVAKAKMEVEEYMKTAANNVDETTIKQLSGADIEEGNKIFVLNCSTCHGKEGQGSVGPNLVDKYWIHGGSLVDIFKSIKYGWVDKGMKSWKDDLSPMQIAQISSYIRTIIGTNPAGAKAPQGDLYQEEGALAADSTVVIADSLLVKKDTLK